MHCPSNSLYPAIDFVLHDRPQQWVLESIREKWILASLSIGAAVDLQCEAILSEPFYCCVAGIIALAHQEWVAGGILNRRRWSYRITLPVADR